MALTIDTVERIPGANSIIEAPSILVPVRHTADFRMVLADLEDMGAVVTIEKTDRKLFSTLYSGVTVTGPTRAIKSFLAYLQDVAA